MSFDDVRLPPDVETAAVGGPTFNTSILSLANGYEVRVQNALRARASYDIGYGVTSFAYLNAVRNFFYARRGRSRGFRFKDWSDYQAVDTPLSLLTGGASGQYVLTKRYSDDALSYDRVITRVVPGTLKINGSATGFTESYGLVTFAGGGTPTASFEFDVPVRFDTDMFDMTVYTEDAAEVPSLKLIEVLESVRTLNGI